MLVFGSLFFLKLTLFLGTGCNFTNFFKSPVDEDAFSVAWAMGLILFDCLIYSCLTIYFDKVCYVVDCSNTIFYLFNCAFSRLRDNLLSL